MNLQLANDVVTELHCTLGLRPDSIPKTEFAVEAFIIYTSFNGDCVRISPAENDTFESITHQPNRENPDTYQTPCVSVVCQEDDPIDGPGDVLCLTYYDGNNIPAGPRHALVVTNLTTKTLLYWRQRGQDPLSEWKYNIYAHCQFDFKFNLDGSDPRYMTHEKYYAHLKDLKVDTFIGVDSSTPFLAETAYLNFWNAEHNGIPREKGISFDCTADESKDENGLNQVVLTVTCNNHDNIEPLTFAYVIEPKNGQHSLMFMDGDSIIYEHGVCNGMANDPLITDESGNPLFIGEAFRD